MNLQQITDSILARRTFLCVGLDTDIKKIPAHLLELPRPCLEFNKAIIDATAPHCVAFKPNTAFYEDRGAEGWADLADTIRYIKEKYPHHLVIADAKRGDIGNTSAMYARAFFSDLKADALTVAPYMGEDSVTPFLGYPDTWVVLLALTSNKGAFDFQTTPMADGRPLWQHVLEKSGQWAGPDKMMYVVGATKADMLAEVRKIVPDSFLLVPGIGAQGGSLADVCRYGLNSRCGLLVNSSRGIIYASHGEDFADAARCEAEKLHTEMAKALDDANI